MENKIKYYLLLLFFTPIVILAQKTIIQGKVLDGHTNEPLEFVRTQFLNSKYGTITDSTGYFYLETFYATDSIQIHLAGYKTQYLPVNLEEDNHYNIQLFLIIDDIEEIFITPSNEPFSTKLHKLIVRNKPINNREKLESFEYEAYTKMRFDIANIGQAFRNRKIINKIKVINDYMDSTETGKLVLPSILSETISKVYYNRDPQKKREIIEATQLTGIEVLNFDQFTGEMYMDLNIYDNYIRVFNKQFVSPIANFARSYYNFVLMDSLYIDGYWCYNMRFSPKRKGDLTFEGSMIVHDSTYAIKSITGNISKDANINFINKISFKQDFKQVESEIWMMTHESLFLDANITKKTKLFGINAHRNTFRKDFKVNVKYPKGFFKTDSTVEMKDSAKLRTIEYWDTHRQDTLNKREKGVPEMIDTINNLPFFKFLKGSIYLISTGYWKQGYLEYGKLYTVASSNPVEKFRIGVELRTSNKFSKRVELMGRVFYGFGDKEFKYGGRIRYNITPKKRGMLSLFYNKDIEQLGAGPSASSVGSAFGSIIRTGPLDKLTMVEKIGIELEKDLFKDIVVFGGIQWKEYRPLGLANYIRINEVTGQNDTINRIQNAEITLRFRWSKNEEFVSGKFDRSIVRSKFPVFSLQTSFGLKGLFGSDYSYQKIDFMYDHQRPIGILGNIRYGFGVGVILGQVAYPFLKVHEGNQSLFLYKNSFNMLNYFEFISDKYVDAFIENHWGGLFLDYIPGIQKLKIRFVTSARATWGTISTKHNREMILPNFTKQFGNIPYVECSVGLENILKFIRVDLFYRATHQLENSSPFGIRARFEFYL